MIFEFLKIDDVQFFPLIRCAIWREVVSFLWGNRNLITKYRNTDYLPVYEVHVNVTKDMFKPVGIKYSYSRNETVSFLMLLIVQVI